jgi:uncharacterized Zn-finger protein
MELFCKECAFYTNRRANYDRHLQTSKHIKKSKSEQKEHFDHPKEYFDHPKEPSKEPSKDSEPACKYCGQVFKHLRSVSKHIKYSCKKNTDEDLQELVRLLNVQLQQKDHELETQKKHMETQQRQIEKLMDKLQVNHFTYVQNVNILSYRNTDVSHLTHEDYSRAIMKVNSCVKEMIEKIHFNPAKPENMNIYISNMKDKYIMVYEDGNWTIKNKASELNGLYEEKEMLLEDWLDEYGNPTLRQKFDKYLTNKTDEETMSMIKDNIKMMMYNKKKLLGV